MSTNCTVRQLTIDLITDQHNEILSFMEDLCNRLTKVNVKVYNKFGKEYVYYFTHVDHKNINRKKAVFYYDGSDNNKLYCDDRYFWDVLVSKFNLSPGNEIPVIKYLVDHYLNINPRYIDVIQLYYIEPILSAINQK